MNAPVRANFEDWIDFSNSFMVGLEMLCGGGSDELSWLISASKCPKIHATFRKPSDPTCR
jgi:hypothetical protein